MQLPALVRPPLRTVLPAGIVASLGYLIAQTVDERVLRSGYDDVILWGGLLSRDPRRQRLLGLTVHFSLGLSLAAAYVAVLPGLPDLPGPIRGLLFAEAENTLAYPCVPLINRVHPEVRSNRLPSLTTWRYWAVETFRHAVYGLLLGAIAPKRPRR